MKVNDQKKKKLIILITKNDYKNNWSVYNWERTNLIYHVKRSNRPVLSMVEI